ncbi:MAG: molybdopterin molybdotransferase MoeA [Proteobacteria bacterium]|nr:molybdopterin molybdotransferase MoeA [Pseudomonadota bacterium]
MVPIASALETVMTACSTRGIVRVPLLDALGRVLAEDVASTCDLPPFDNSAMDGFALRAADAAEPGSILPVSGESRAGGPEPAPLSPKTARRIFTGAPLPAGADSVVMQEHTESVGDGVRLLQAVRFGANVRARGSDLVRHERAVAAGQVLGPGELGMLSAQDRAVISVYRRPRVAIVTTGDELRDLGAAGTPTSIVNSNAYSLAAQVREAGGVAQVLPSVTDNLSSVLEAVRAGLELDVLITSGGASVGQYDIVREALCRANITIRFHKVAMKPGKPVIFGLASKTLVFGLPGNPVSSLVAFEIFVRPALRRILGDRTPYRVTSLARVTGSYQRSRGRTELARAALRHRDGTLEATLHCKQGSGSLASLVALDGLVIIPPELTSLEAGTTLPALLLRSSGASDPPPF